MRARTSVIFFCFALLFARTSFPLAPAPQIEWSRQFGTSGYDPGQDIAVDATGIYVTAYTGGTLGDSHIGGDDVVVRKYDPSGTVQWTKQVGSTSTDTPESITTDDLGNFYVAGTTSGNLAASPIGERDAFVMKYSAAGTLQWSRQIGTTSTERGLSVFADANGVYVSGLTEGNMNGGSKGTGDAFVQKFSTAGTPVWTRQYGTSQYDFGNGVAADSAGNVYLVGETNIYSGATITDEDAFLVKYDSTGNLVWSRSIQPTTQTGAADVVIKGNAIYVVGDINTNGGEWDAFATRYDLNGTPQWYSQWGSSASSVPSDFATDVALDAQGGIVVSGTTRNSLAGPNQGGEDVMVAKFDANGVQTWLKQFGTSDADEGNGVAMDNSGNVYVTGGTLGALGGANAGAFDAFVVKLSYVPEPSTVAMSLFAAGPFFLSGRRRNSAI